MPRLPLRSLRLRLLSTLGLSVLVALAAAAVLSRGATENEFERYVGRSRGEVQTAFRQIAPVVGGRVVVANDEGRVVVDSAGEWIGWVASPAPPAPPAPPVPPGAARRFLVEGVEGPPGEARAVALAKEAAAPQGGAVAKEAGVPQGVARVRPAVAPPPDVLFFRPDPGSQAPLGIYAPERHFLGAVERSLVAGAVAGGVFALALGLALSQRILQPIDSLTAAVRRMGAGDLDQRVPVVADDEIGELARAFNAMAGSLARTERLRRTMVTDVAHELRTPLTNLRGYLEALQDGVASPGPEVITSLHEEAVHLSRLVDDLQDLALAEAGQLPLERRPVPVADVVAPVARLLASQLSAHGVTLEIYLPLALPPADDARSRPRQTTPHLACNPVRHTPRGWRVH